MDLSPKSNGKLVKGSIKFKAGGWVDGWVDGCDTIKPYLKLTGLSEYGADWKGEERTQAIVASYYTSIGKQGVARSKMARVGIEWRWQN